MGDTLDTVSKLFGIWLAIVILSKGKLESGTPFLLTVAIGLFCNGVDRSFEPSDPPRIEQAVDAENEQRGSHESTVERGHDSPASVVRIPPRVLEAAQKYRNSE